MIVGNSVRSTTRLEVELVKREFDRETAPEAAIALFTVYLVLVLATIAMFLLLTTSAWKPKKVITTQSLDQIPCRNCQFFKENQYLRCAVHPAIALTQQAIDCQDYESLNKPDT
jgi:hypothetical protein